MITTTSLKHPKVRRKIIAASVNAMNGYSVDHVRDASGRAYLAVRYIREANRFWVVDGKGRDVTEAVSNALKG